MKHALYIWLCILISYNGFGQLTNDWIDYNKQYYKIKVYQDGIYRIDYGTLQLAGIPISSINRRDFQIYGRGKELYIYVAGAPASSALGAGDYIEFYGEKNTGWLDTAFYEDPTWHANPNISLFTDSATYFLTWETTTNRRLTEETNMNFLGKTSENYFMFESRADYFDTPYGGPYFLASGLALYESGITEAQGWSGPAFTSAITLSVPTTNVYTGGPMATASAGLIGANLNNHNVTVSVASVGSTVSYSSIKANKLSYNANPANLGSLSTNFLFSPQPSVNDRNTVAFVALEYPHTMNLGGVSSMHMDIPDASGDTAYLNLTNFNDQGQTTWLYDLDNYRRIAVGDNGSAHEVLVPNSGTSKRCFLFSESTITVVTTLVSVGDSGNGLFTDYAASPHDSAYLIVYNRKLEDDGNGNNFIQEYINYRTSPDGGGFDVVEADIDQLYDQFSYGIRKNPMAIRGFAEYTLTSPDWPTKPQNLLILGKGVSHRWSRSTSIYYDRVLVPTYGWPSSDNLLTAGLDGTLYAPAIPTGRIAAATGFEVGEYLNKVEEFDANQDTSYLEQLIELEEWKKQLMFFAGGTGSEHTQFRTFLKGYENIMEDTLFGGKIHQYNKNSSALIQITTSDSIENLINNGVTILQFFGHASGSGFDQNIDNPDVYQNTNGKYPLLIANSCLVGDIHQPQYESNSEDWVLHPRGTIGFLASVHFGEPGPLNEYTIELYRNMGQLMYGKSIGAIIQQTIKDVEDPSGNNSDNLRETCLLMTLHGDPAMVMNTRSLPDYAIRKRDVYTTPEIVSSEVDSFDLNLIVTNIGKAINTEIGIKITRRFPESSTPEQDTTIVAYNIYYKDTLTVRLPVDLANGVGTNNFEIRIDDIGAVDEIENVLNNNIVYSLLIRSDDLIPIYPYEFAVVPDKMQTLKASTGNPFAPNAVYHFQVDTSDAFSPPLAEDSMGQSGGVVEWKPVGNTLEAIFSSAADSTVFFWRVRRDSLWRESSFQYIQGKRGWGQAHFHQFKNDEYNLIEYNKPSRSFDYVTAPKELWCQTVGDATTTPDWLKTEYRINGSVQIASSCGTAPAVLVAVIDPLTLEPATSYCGTDNIPISVFYIASSSEQANLANYLDAVPNGFYILAYSFYKGLVDTWSNALINEFQSLGWNSIADSIKTPGNLKPFIYFVKKGDLSTVKDTIGIDAFAKIWLTTDLVTDNDFGYFTTRNIGPVEDWVSLHWDMAKLEASDNVSLEVSGIDASGNTVVIPGLANLPPDSSDIYNLSSRINDSTYRNIRLRVYKKDSLLKTAAQLRSWHVLLDDVPESALNPSIHLAFYNDTVDEGEIISFSTVVQNVSEYDMDSLLISFWIVDKDRVIIPLPSIRYKPLLQSPDTILTGLTFSTKGLGGHNSLWIEVNPYVTSKGDYDQLEKYHFNNIAGLPFYVTRDKMNPLVDVTFDGTHILDGDIVSAEPQIVIELKDENKYLSLDNSSLMKVYLTEEGQSLGSPIPYSPNMLRFVPASLPENRARVEFEPGLLKDGIYELTVQANDVSKNNSGDLDYMISFEVINRPTITSVMNWPNPFSTSTKFVFTLTGSEVPQDFRIRILTISGRVVREIFADELGPIHIGKNITEYAWDGRDEFGDQLANGVYLYKVDIQLNEQVMERRETNADQYFHKGYGKMYLLRGN